MVAKLSAEVLKIIAAPDRDERGNAWGFRVDARGPQVFGKFLGDETLLVAHHRRGQDHDGAGRSCRVCVGRGRRLTPCPRVRLTLTSAAAASSVARCALR